MDSVRDLFTLNLPEDWLGRLCGQSQKGLGFHFEDIRAWVTSDSPFLPDNKHLLFVQFEYRYPGTGKWRIFRRDLCLAQDLPQALKDARQHLKSFRGE
jgi:hypothetical protein